MNFLIVLLFAALVFVGPVLTILSLNVVFSLGIPMTLETWLGVLWLGLLFAPKSK